MRLMWPSALSARLWLDEDPLSGDRFVFVNRRPAQMRVLYFAGDGLCLWSKRRECGPFQVSGVGGKQAIDYSIWQMIVDGIDLRTVR